MHPQKTNVTIPYGGACLQIAGGHRQNGWQAAYARNCWIAWYLERIRCMKVIKMAKIDILVIQSAMYENLVKTHV